MATLNLITKILIYLLSATVLFHILYLIIGFFSKKKTFPETDIKKKYACLIASRNEEAVIKNLIESLKKQNYDSKLVTIFLVADNCTDKTAEIAREAGAIVYERFDETKARKGWALEFLVDNIEKDYGVSSFDYFLVFDSDNVVDPNFIVEMNKAFATGADVVTGYRNTKNFGTNFISAAYGMHFCRSTLTLHRPRTKLKTSTHLAGTGYGISSKYLVDGWKYHSLTEDSELTADLAIQGAKVVVCEDAQFYDEQPTNFKVAWRQRLRWGRGRLGVFLKKCWPLFKGIFTRPFGEKWACYDVLIYLFPYALVSMILSAIYPVASFITSVASHQAINWLGMLKAAGIGLLTAYLISLLKGALILIREHNRIVCPVYKQVLYCLIWPWFDLINLPLLIVAVFYPVKWTPIVHKDTTQIEDINKELSELRSSKKERGKYKVSFSLLFSKSKYKSLLIRDCKRRSSKVR